ncbi:MAG: phage tail family protein [Lachnospiraceae bacterium]|nr:phage tail family protein [Lachnospiraceae bacterium]
MKTIKCVNDNGMFVEFTYDHDATEFFLVSADGIYNMDNAISTTQNATTDGSTYAGEAIQQRNIVITAQMRRNYQENRNLLSMVFCNRAQGTLYHIENGQSKKIRYRAENLNIEEKGILRVATISLICTNPYFSDGEPENIEMSGWEDYFEFPIEISESGMEFGIRKKELIKSIENNSTTSIGITMTITAEDIVVNPAIINVTTQETLKLLCTMLPNDRVVVTTEQGNIDVVLYRDNEMMNYNYTVDEDNEDYIQLEPGHNDISYTADEGRDYMSVSFTFENQYTMP